jgi:hypothetical protein
MVVIMRARPSYELRTAQDRARTLCADNDFAALSAAFSRCGTRKVEIWRDGRCVATLEKGALPLGFLWSDAC